MATKLCRFCGILLLIFIICISFINASITEREYNLMPPVFHLDDYDTCMQVDENPIYCSVRIQLLPINKQNPSEIWNIIAKTLNDTKYYRHDLLRYGLCLKTSCPNFFKPSIENIKDNNTLLEHIRECYAEKYKEYGLKGNVSEIHCETNTNQYSVDAYDLIVGFVFLFYVLLVVTFSIIEGNARYRDKESYEKFLNSKLGTASSIFSLPRNWHKMKKLNNSPDFRSLRSIQGIRCYNMIYIIMMHASMLVMAGPVSNTHFVENISNMFPNNYVTAAFNYAIQTFLLISGWLLGYNFFLLFEGNKNIDVKYLILSFINRYLRLTPVMLFALALHSTWLVHFSNGPRWDQVIGTEYRNCRKNWWTNLLYINNYYDPQHMCLPQSWYLATDMQLYVVALVIILIMWKYQNRIKLILSSSLIISVLILGIVNYANNFEILVRQYPERIMATPMSIPQWHIMYSSAYSNIGSYMLGLAFGYLFYKHRGEELFKNKIYVIMWWLLFPGLPIMAAAIAAEAFKSNINYGRFGTAVLVALSRNMYALGIGIGIFGMSQRIGWFARWFTEWSVIQVFGQLSYSAYLIHSAIQKTKIASIRSPTNVSNVSLIILAISDVTVAYAVALILYLTVEMPFSSLQRLLVPKNGEKRKIGLSEKSQLRLGINVKK